MSSRAKAVGDPYVRLRFDVSVWYYLALTFSWSFRLSYVFFMPVATGSIFAMEVYSSVAIAVFGLVAGLLLYKCRSQSFPKVKLEMC